MHLFTDSKVALREAVTRKSARLSPWELIAGGTGVHTQKELIAKLLSASSDYEKIDGCVKGQSKKRTRPEKFQNRKGDAGRLVSTMVIGRWIQLSCVDESRKTTKRERRPK
jgi:hypothetical protein